ncbi:unnamed protein product [Brassica oleracea var. botrytis]|uniref:SWIM-type domain-containing protein n=1 Tax=Brassica oleracea TaxID=3712 RepID=A0A3P6DGW7_BRAOL|nr:unnamed protein product [Brassica oleracea]
MTVEDGGEGHDEEGVSFGGKTLHNLSISLLSKKKTLTKVKAENELMLSRFEQMTGQDKVLLVHGTWVRDSDQRWIFEPDITSKRLQTFVLDTPGLVFISDRHASIATRLRKVYNHAQHVICVVHLWRNVIAKYKSSRLANLMSAAARAFTVTEFNKKFIEIQKISPNCEAYLVDIVMSWFALRRAKSTREQGTITPNVRKLVEENFDLSTAMAVRDIADLEYQVQDPTGECFTVLLGPGTCTCGEYQLIGIPCMHALACSTRVGFPSDALVAPAYRVPTWRQGFIGKIYPVPSVGGL